MFKLNLESTNSGDYVATHKDGACLYRVTIMQDSDCSDPLDDDGMWPMIIGTDERGNVPLPLDCFTDGQLIRYQRAIAAALSDSDYRWHDSALSPVDDLKHWKSDYADDYRGYPASLIRDYCSKLYDDLPAGDRFAAMVALYSLAGIEAIDTCVSGYGQGDYADVLIVATPDAMRAFGWTRKQQRDKSAMRADMERQVALYGQWWRGDCYGYIVERRAPSGDWQDVDSCWGFIGDPDTPDAYGVGEAASAIKLDIQLRARRRALRLAQLIRARVATDKRAALLDIAEYGA